MANHRIYQYTSIGRPIEPVVASVKVVLVLLLLAAVLGLVLTLVDGEGLVAAGLNALSFVLAVYGSWALARELDPDDTPAAFISVAAALLAISLVDSAGLLIVYVTLGLVRVVNRSSGLVARKSDSLIIMALSIWVMYATQSPFFGLVAALAFFMDGSLKDALRHQWVFGLVCFGGMVVYMVDHDFSLAQMRIPATLFEWISILFILIYALDTLLLKRVRTRGDVTGLRLDVGRVRGGMTVGFLAAAQGVTQPENVVIIVATLAGLCVGIALRKSFRVPARRR